MAERSELAAALRAWRDRVRPEEVGLTTGAGRRAPGLRREELAALAGVSVDYLVRLEQGRATSPSPQVLAALARALRLDDAERGLLYRTAGAVPPSPAVVPRHLSAGVQRILDRLADTPVGVFTASWDALLLTPLWRALFGETEARTGRSANLIWRHFAEGRTAIVRGSEDEERFARTMVSDLHEAAARYPRDRELAEMIRDLRVASGRFAELWDAYTVERQISERKTIRSPALGLVTLDCDVLVAPDSDARLVVYTARPGSEDAGKLELLRVAGIQAL